MRIYTGTLRIDSEERRDELQKRQHELICDLNDMEKQGCIGKSLEQVKRVKKEERRRRHAEFRT